MQSKNSFCNCGSGKKFKRCCLLKMATAVKQKFTGKADSFYKVYDLVDLLKTIGALQTIAQNHSKNVRLENIVLEILSNSSETGRAVTHNRLRKFLNENYPEHHMEDIPINPFTDLVTFYGGDYIIYPGISENSAFILRNLIAAVFASNHPGVTDGFQNMCYQVLQLLLNISNDIITDFGHPRYYKEAKEDDKIEVLDETSFNNHKVAVTFSLEYIQNLSDKHNIAESIVKEFTITPEML